MGNQFDELSKALAGGMSRRRAFRRFAAGVMGAALANLFPWRAPEAAAQAKSVNAIGDDDDEDDEDEDEDDEDDDNPCYDWCNHYPPGPQRDECISASETCPPEHCPAIVNGTTIFVNGQPVCVNAQNSICVDWCNQLPLGPQRDECIYNSETCPPGHCPSVVNGTTIFMNGQPVCVSVAP